MNLRFIQARIKWAGLVLFTIALTQCQKQEELISQDSHYFKVNFTVENTQDSMVVGDTLWISSTIPGYLIDTATNKYFYITDAVISMNPIIRSWKADDQQYQSDNYHFSFDSPGNYLFRTNEATVFDLQYAKTGSDYHARFGVIFNNTGIYSIDGDYLKYNNIATNSTEYYGGGTIVFYNSDQSYQSGYLLSYFDSEVNHLRWYNQLSEQEKLVFQPIDEQNAEKYYFIKIVNR